MAEFDISINDGAWTQYSQTLPYNLAGVIATDKVEVRARGAEVTLSPAASFSARSANFGNSGHFKSTSTTMTGTNTGLMSMWIYSNPATWPSTDDLFQLRIGATTPLSLSTASGGRLSFSLPQDGSGPNSFTSASSTFITQRWHHIMWAWDWPNSRFQVCKDDSLLSTTSYTFGGNTKFNINSAAGAITGHGMGATSTGGGIADFQFGHVYVNLAETLDLSVEANRRKFINSSGDPVDLGEFGGTPLTSAPLFYYDGTVGVGDGFTNKGTGPVITATGTITAGGTPALP